LIDGLHTAGDVRRLRHPVPAFNEVKDDIQLAEKSLRATSADAAKLDDLIRDAEAKLRRSLESLARPAVDISDIDRAIASLQSTPEEERLAELARIRRDLNAAIEEWNDLANTGQSEVRAKSEQDANAARKELEQWQAGPGNVLGGIAAEVAALFPDLQLPASTNPERARTAALRAIQKELERCQSLLSEDERASARLKALGEELEKVATRSQRLDQQIQSISAGAGQLARALAGLIPHIHSDDCPVCNRAFGEISRTPLSAHVSARIASLTESAGRLEALSKEKATAVSASATLERERSQLAARLISAETRNELKTRSARLAELMAQLADLAVQAAQGMSLLARATSTSATLDQLRSRDQRTTNLRTTIANMAEALAADGDSGLPIGNALAALRARRDQEDQQLTSALAVRRNALTQAREVQRLKKERAAVQQEQTALQAKFTKLSAAKDRAEDVIASARDLAHRASDVRTAIVRRIFNNSLNAIWRDLFVRLAPDENFVPAFALPDGPGPIEADLETHYRAGGKGGNPRAMLSAGNLNTAALTLFLALHLSAKPQLPWLIIDDPVQSMDELHVAQFAVLLRTLAKGHNRQIILAVHERALFDYLALELSPAFQNDRLITLELGRAADGATTHDWNTHIYEPDKAIAA
jgi:exonuclease SbcC